MAPSSRQVVVLRRARLSTFLIRPLASKAGQELRPCLGSRLSNQSFSLKLADYVPVGFQFKLILPPSQSRERWRSRSQKQLSRHAQLVDLIWRGSQLVPTSRARRRLRLSSPAQLVGSFPTSRGNCLFCIGACGHYEVCLQRKAAANKSHLS